MFYRHYVLQQREERTESYLIDGKVIHCLLLDDGSFNKHFILMPASLPGDSTRKIVDKIYDIVKEGPGLLENYDQEILDVLKEINLHQSLKTDKQRIEKIVTEESKSYFEFLKIKGNKDLLDTETMQRCNEAVDAIKNNSVACNLLGLIKHEMENIDIFNEIPLQSDLVDAYPFGMKGIVDNIKVEYDTKTVHINDLKTTGKTIVDFEDSIEYFNYWIQAAMYERLVREAFKDLLTQDWKIQFHFIVVDKYNQVYSFEISSATMMIWQERLETKLNEFKWHYTEKKYALPYLFATSQIIL
ncbi:MAG: PD-(D/E)XK nuclease-like domain-containing protein [Sphingobacteriaceae bacterium]|nr:PD-(D/E)XK nuclease-like domain-containing protein [Sphingobacteriaceae bacterium]